MAVFNNATGLKQVADDAVGLRERALNDDDAQGRGAGERREAVGEGAACDACADDDHVVI